LDPLAARRLHLELYIGRGPDTVFHAVIRFGSYSVISYIASIRLPRNSPTKQDVAPTPGGPLTCSWPQPIRGATSRHSQGWPEMQRPPQGVG
jgi:hypothetical protein